MHVLAYLTTADTINAKRGRLNDRRTTAAKTDHPNADPNAFDDKVRSERRTPPTRQEPLTPYYSEALGHKTNARIRTHRPHPAKILRVLRTKRNISPPMRVGTKRIPRQPMANGTSTQENLHHNAGGAKSSTLHGRVHQLASRQAELNPISDRRVPLHRTPLARDVSALPGDSRAKGSATIRRIDGQPQTKKGPGHQKG